MPRRLVTAVAVAALALVGFPGTADAARSNKCDNQTADITGTGKSETFTLTSQKRSVNAHGGDDVIFGDYTLFNSPATVCMGSGDDVLRPTDGPEGVAVQYLHGGKGYDTAEIYACFQGDSGPKIEVVSIERLIIINCED